MSECGNRVSVASAVELAACLSSWALSPPGNLCPVRIQERENEKEGGRSER